MKPRKVPVSPTNPEEVHPSRVKSMGELIEELLTKNAERNLREQVAGWRPIAEYDAMAEKPKGFIVFRAAEHKNGRHVLPEAISKDRWMGFRTITHFYVLPEIPAE